MYSSYSVAAAVCSVVFPVLATLAVLLRLRARMINSIPYGPDDYAIIVSLIFSITLDCMVLYGACDAGVGQLLSTMTPAEFTNYQKHLYFTVIVAHLAIGIVKISVLEFYKRIFDVRNFHRAANIVMVFVVLWILGAFFIFSAWPIPNWWNIRATYTINYGAFMTAFAAMDVVLDVAILCLPLPVIKNLHMSRRRKFTVAGIFWLGFFCVVAASVRLAFAYLLTSGTNVHPTDAHFSYVSVYNVIWSEIEPCASIVAACLPTFGPLVKSGLSLRSLARSFQSNILKRSTASTSDSEHLASNGWPASYAPQPNGWNELKDENNTRPFTADLELARTTKQQSATNETPEAKRAWTQQYTNNTSSSARYVDRGSMEQDEQGSREIRVDKTFASQTDQL